MQEIKLDGLKQDTFQRHHDLRKGKKVKGVPEDHNRWQANQAEKKRRKNRLKESTLAMKKRARAVA